MSDSVYDDILPVLDLCVDTNSVNFGDLLRLPQKGLEELNEGLAILPEEIGISRDFPVAETVCGGWVLEDLDNLLDMPDSNGLNK